MLSKNTLRNMVGIFFIPKFSYTTDNAAMIAITGYFKYLDKDFCSIDLHGLFACDIIISIPYI